MTVSHTVRLATVDRALRRTIPIIGCPRPGEWQLRPPGLRCDATQGRVNGEWLRLMSSEVGEAPSWWELLAINGTQPLGGRCVVDPRSGRPMLYADICLSPEIPLRQRIQEASDWLTGAAAALREWGHARVATPVVEYPDDTAGVPLPLVALLEEIGWPPTEQSGGRLTVNLGHTATGARATVCGRPGGGLRLSISLVDRVESALVREAMAHCVLTTTAVVRGVRGGVLAGVGAIWLEAGFEPQPCPVEAAEAVEALSVAWCLASRQVATLQDADTADAYLARWASRSARIDLPAAG